MPLSSVVGASSILKPGVCTSSTRPAAPFEGQTIYETDTDRLLSYDGSAWIPYVKQTAGKVLQVVSTAKTDTFTGTVGTTPVDVTGLSVAITPTATSSKVLVQVTLNMQHIENRGAFRIVRDSTAVGIGDTAGSRTRATMTNNAGGAMSFVGDFLDSPNTTSATTYKVQVMNSNTGAGSTVWVNREATDTDNASYFRSVSTITVMEISA